MFQHYSKDDSDSYWIYYNGELYHAGVKGMHWYQHLPGTDWWKTAKDYYNADKHYQSMTGKKPSKFKAAVSAFKNVARDAKSTYGKYFREEKKYYGNKLKNSKLGKAYSRFKTGTSKLWNKAKGYSSEQIAKFKESARNAYKSVKKHVRKMMLNYSGSAKGMDYKSKDINYLESYVNEAWKDAFGSYMRAKLTLKGSFKDQLDSCIQATKFNIVKGCSIYLDKIGLDDEVANFLKKFK